MEIEIRSGCLPCFSIWLVLGISGDSLKQGKPRQNSLRDVCPVASSSDKLSNAYQVDASLFLGVGVLN